MGNSRPLGKHAAMFGDDWEPLRRINEYLRDPGAGFDWVGVVVGHWLVQCCRGQGRYGHVMYRCVSFCGVSTVFRKDELQSGASKTCEACRSGSTVPVSRRVVKERDLGPHQHFWERVAMDENSTLKGREVIKDWETHGRAELRRIIEAAGMSVTFGWKVSVRDCYYLPSRTNRETSHVRASKDSMRQVELLINPKAGDYTFMVTLATGRTDRNWVDIRRAIEAALKPPAPAPAPVLEPKVEVEDDQSEVTINTPPDANGTYPAPSSVLGGMPRDQVIGLRDKLNTLLSISDDMTTTEQMKQEALELVAAKEATYRPVKAAADKAEADYARLTQEKQAVQDLVTRLNDQLKQLKAEMAKRNELAGQVEEARMARDEAAKALRPVEQELVEAKKALVEAERMEQDRLRVLGKSEDLALVLAALQRMGSKS